MALSHSYADSLHSKDSLAKSNEGTVLKKASKNISVGYKRSFSQFDHLIQNNLDIEQDVLTPQQVNDTTITQTISKYRQRAKSLMDEVRNSQKFIDVLDETSLLELPVAIKKSIGGVDYSIIIDSVVLAPTHAYLTAYMVLEIPEDSTQIAFRGGNIKFSKKGGIEGDAKLQLIGDYPLKMGEKTLMVLKGEGTHVEWDCDGFKSLGLSADVHFSRDLIVPENADGSIIPNERVQTSFQTTLGSWSDLIVEVSIPNFQVAGLQGVGFNVQNAVLDNSDMRNAPSVTFPAGYEELFPQGNRTLWRGFYMREINVKMPPQFRTEESTERLTFEGSNIIIDRQGFSGLVEAENLIINNQGDLNGWAYTLTHLEIELNQGQLTKGAFEGGIVLPIADERKPFGYSAIIRPDNEYTFKINSVDSLQFTVFKTSEVELYPNSSLEISLENNVFLPKTNFHGRMNISAGLGNDGGKGLELADIKFEGLKVQSVAPFISAERFSFGSEAASQALGDFPVQIQNIGFRNVSTTEVGIDFDLQVNVSEKFSGQSGVTLLGSMREEGKQKWQFEKVQIDEIALDIDGGGFKLNGSLTFYRDDPVYGKGFSGELKAWFNPGLEVNASAIFGTVDGFRYWYADAGVVLPGAGIPLFPPLMMKGFGGGVYYRMSYGNASNSLVSNTSGISYVPNKKSGLGFKASIEFEAGKGSFTGDAAFEMAFFQGGGIKYVSFKGNGYLMAPSPGGSLAKIQEKATKLADAVGKLEEKVGPAGALIAKNAEKDQTITQIYGQIGDAAGKKGSISAHVFISYDFENRVLHGTFESYINVAGGIIKGVGAGGRAGWAVLHIEPGDWYLYVGTPEDRIGISVGVGPIRAKATSYFMMGTQILGSPPPPQEVSDILGGADLDYMRDLNALGTGAGFAFGAAFSVDTGDMTFLMFYARFKAGAGFDIMLKDYGSAECEGSGQIGINGWYANGQAYAYFEGTIGIRIKLFFKTKRIEILSIGAAAVLQAKLPNPFWMRGIVGGRFSVLGGLVKGSCKFQVTIGKECKIVGGSVLESIKIIAEVTPNEGQSDVNVFTSPQAVFNMPVDKVFEMVDIDEKKKQFRIKLGRFEVTNGTQKVNGELQWNGEKDVLVFNSYDVLPPKKKLKASAEVFFQENNGGWKDVIVDGKKYLEKLETTFTTGEAPDHIPLENVAYSYPLIDQLNFYRNEASAGYIKLKKGQPYLFQPGSEWKQVARFNSGGDKKEVGLNYNSSNRQVNYNIADNLILNTSYSFSLVNVPAQAQGSIDRNVTASARKLDKTEIKLVTKKAEGTLTQLQEKEVFSSTFRTSQYSTFRSKILAQKVLQTDRAPLVLWKVYYVNSGIENPEVFSREELIGNEHTGNKPLVTAKADLTTNEYFNQLINPLVYDQYPIDGDIRITHRNVSELGVVPFRAIQIDQSDPFIDLISSGGNPPANEYMDLRNMLPYYMYYDFKEIQKKVIDRYISNSTFRPRIERIIWAQFPVVIKGNYDVNYSYRLPGQNQDHTTVKLPVKLLSD